MARVIRLPSGRVFRAEPLVDDPRKLGMGNKGAFDFSETVKLLDQVAESKGIGAVANLVEKGYDAARGDVKRPSEEKKDKGPADALTQAAKARVSKAGERMPAAGMRREGQRPAETALPREPTFDPRFSTPDPNFGPLFPAAQEGRRQAMMREPDRQRKAIAELPEQQIVVRDDSVTRLTRRPERKLVRNTRAGIEAGGPPIVYEDQLARSPEGVVEQPKVPPLQVPGPAQPAPPQAPLPQMATPAPAPAPAPAPEPPPRQMVVPVPTQPAPGMTGGGAPITQRSMGAQAQAAGQQIAANVLQEAQRKEPVQAAQIDLTQFSSPTGQARGSIQFFSELADTLQKRGVGIEESSQTPMEIPYTVSIDELYGYARNARTYENQKRVLDALANNRVTGMGFETLADRLSGAYRQRYLANITSMFPKIANQPNLIESIGTVGKAYAAEQLGRRRAEDIAAGAPSAAVTRTLAQAGQAAAGGQLAAERAVTERETRAAKAQDLLGKTASRIYNDAYKRSKKVGKKGKTKINIREFRSVTSDVFTKEQDRLGRQLDRLDDQIAKAQGEAALADIPPPTQRDVVLNPQGANQTRRDIAKGQAAKKRLAALEAKRRETQGVYDGLAKRRTAFDTLISRMATGYKPSQEELEAAGLSAQQALQFMRGIGGIRSRRRSGPSKTPATKQAPKPKVDIKF